MLLQHEGYNFGTTHRVLEHRHSILVELGDILITLQTYLP